MILESIPQIRNLTPEEKLALSDELWQDVVGESYLETDPDLVSKLQERLSEYQKDPKQAVSSDEMKARFKRNKNG